MKEGIIPLRDERKVCYVARDAFFACCDKNNIDNPMRDVESAKRKCGAEKARFEKDCISSWVIILTSQSTASLLIDGAGGLFFAKENHR